MSRSALFVIDIQHELAQDPKTQIPHAERVCAASEKILTAARSIVDSYRMKDQRSPSVIVFVQHEEKPDDGTLVRDTGPWRLVYEPRPGVEEEFLVAKTTRQWDHPHRLRLLYESQSVPGSDHLSGQPTFELTCTHLQVIPSSRIQLWQGS